MAKPRALFRQDSLHSFLWGQPIVSTARGLEVTSVVSDCIVRWGLLYNLYADRLLGFNMFPQSVYDTREHHPFTRITWIQTNSTTETKWYATKLSDFGIQLDSR